MEYKQWRGVSKYVGVPAIPTPTTCLVPVRRSQVEPLQVEPVFPVNRVLETGG